MKSKDFIKKILNLDVDKVEKSVKKSVMKNIINHKDWSIKNITSAYGAAGILA